MEATSLQHPGRPAQAGAILRAPGLGGWLLIALLAGCLYAAFNSGATGVYNESHLQLGTAAMLAIAGIGVAARALRVPRSTRAWAGVGLIALFGLFSGLSISWSIAPDNTWLATNRAIAYAIVVTVALIVGATVRRSERLVAIGIPLVVLPVALYALGGKIAPGISLAGIDLNHTAEFQRLREPIGYWNALGLLCVFGTPACIWGAADRDWEPPLRIAALLSLTVLVVTAALTYSRGAVLAYIAVVALMVSAGPDRLRRLAVALLGVAAAVPAVAFAFSNHDLTTDRLPVSARSGAGVVLGLILVAILAVLVFVARRVLAAERRGRWTPRHSRAAQRALTGGLVALVLAGAIGMASSQRGLTGTISHQWQQFKKAKGAAQQPGRLLSTNSSNRWIWWSEAAGAFSDRPLAGWGAGSFPLLHNLYRQHEAPVRSTHSVELQFLSETGLIGAALGLGGLGLLGAAAVRGVRRSSGIDRSARLVLTAVAGAWAIHSAYDWDWEIPAVTVPALIAVAVAAVPPRGRRGPLVPAPPPGAGEPRRWQLSAAAALVAVALAISAVAPSLAETRRREALVFNAQTPAALRVAQSAADLARRINPLSVQNLFTEASLARRRGDEAGAAALLAKAVTIQPDNARVWVAVTTFYLPYEQARILARATREWSKTDPLSFKVTPPLVLGRLFTFAVPPYRSPTAWGTPTPTPQQLIAALSPPAP